MRTSHLRRTVSGGLLGLGLALSLLLAGCAGAPAPSPSPAVSLSAPAQSAAPSDVPSAAIQAGTWLSDQGQYWSFDPDGASGRTSSLADGTGTGFAYTVEGDRAVFSMGGADSGRACTLSGDRASGPLTLQWEDGGTEVLTYVSSLGSDQFVFYTDQQLCQLALEYYRAHGDGQDTDGLTAAAAANEDGTVTIQVYENLGDHNSTAAWYTVDRTTARGTDAAGQAVDLAG